MYNLAFLYYQKGETFGDDHYFDAALWTRTLLDEEPDSGEGNYLMGLLFEGGKGVDKNYSYAFQYFKKAADLNHVKAMTKLAHFYYSGVVSSQLQA